MSRQICAHLLAAIAQWQPHSVHVFLPIVEKKEVNTTFLIEALQHKLKIITSRTNWDTMEMENVELLPETELALNKWGVPEPLGGAIVPEQEVDVVIVPLLAFDVQGHRVGYGKGFYDKFLAKCKKEVIKAGVSFFGPEEKIDDVFKEDIALDYCFTPAEIYQFSKV